MGRGWGGYWGHWEAVGRILGTLGGWGGEMGSIRDGEEIGDWGYLGRVG